MNIIRATNMLSTILLIVIYYLTSSEGFLLLSNKSIPITRIATSPNNNNVPPSPILKRLENSSLNGIRELKQKYWDSNWDGDDVRRSVNSIPITGLNTSPNGFRQRQEKYWDGNWDGDDVRRLTRLKRKMGRFLNVRIAFATHVPLLLTNVSIYLWQVLSNLHQTTIIFGGRGPFITVKNLIFTPLYFAGKRQPYRLLTSGFLHSNVLHLILNMYALQELPTWLEDGLGWPLTITTYIIGIISGTYLQSSFDALKGASSTVVVGSGGAIMALAGLAVVALVKMEKKNTSAQSSRNKILKSSIIFALLSYRLLPKGVLLPQLIGGFVSGCLMGVLFSPGYRSSYSLMRKNSLETDVASSEYRQEMGFGIIPNRKPPLQLWMVWAAILFYIVRFPKILYY